MKYTVDKDLCIGCGVCASVCADCFEMGDDGLAYFIEASTNTECCEEAMENCPVTAIKQA